jgi:hypothetical protein
MPRLRGRGAAAAALIGYGLLTLAMTYPLVTRFTTAIPGDGFDGWQHTWNLWWVRRALLVEHAHPWFTDMLYYPVGVSLLFHTLNLFNGLTTLPMQLAWGLLPAYNSAVLFSFAVSGLGAYLLARTVLGPRSSRLAAFAAGIIFTFSPFHIAHLLGHMQVLSMEWVPFFSLYLLRTVKGEWASGRAGEAAKRRSGEAADRHVSESANHDSRLTFDASRFTLHVSRATRHNLLLAILFLGLTALCDWYYVLYCLIFTAVVFFWIAIRSWKAHRPADTRVDGDPSTLTPGRSLVRIPVAMAVIWLLWGIVLSPVLAPMIREAREYSFMVPNPEDSRRYSADLLGFVVPQQFHPLWGRLVAAWSQAIFRATVSEYQVFAGFTVLALALVGIWSTWRGSAAQPKVSGAARVSFQCLWPWVALVYFVLALGPVLHIAGQTALLPGGRELPLPYAGLVRVVPFMNISRSVSRYDAMVMLALAILAALGLNWLIFRFRRGRFVAVAATALIVFEFLPIPYPLSISDAPGWYATLAQDARPGSVLNLPMNWDRPNYLLYQTVHGKPLVAGYISRDDPRTLAELAPVFQHFRHLSPDIIALDLASQGQQVLHDLGVRWVVLDRYQMPASPGSITREYTMETAAQIFGDQPPAYQDDRIIAYEVLPPRQSAPFPLLGRGWTSFDAERRSRAFQDAAEVIVRAPGPASGALRITLAPGSAPLAADEVGDQFTIPLSLGDGDNAVTLRSRQPGQRVEVSRLELEVPD